MKNAYEKKYQDGYRYAYTYPGVAKVLQAAGRIIRTERDRGALLLIDARYGYAEYRDLLPAAWHMRRVRTNRALEESVRAFFAGETPG